MMEKLKEQIQSIVDIYKSGNLLEAEFLTGQLINNNPKVVFLYNLLGLILAEQKKDDQAMKCYEKGIDIDPNYGMIYNNIGLLFYKQKTTDNIKKAENFYKKAISLDKRIPEPHNNLGNLYDYLDKIAALTIPNAIELKLPTATQRACVELLSFKVYNL